MFLMESNSSRGKLRLVSRVSREAFSSGSTCKRANSLGSKMSIISKQLKFVLLFQYLGLFAYTLGLLSPCNFLLIVLICVNLFIILSPLWYFCFSAFLNVIIKWTLILQHSDSFNVMIRKVIHGFGSLTSIRILSRVFQFILKTYLIRNLLDKELLGHMLQLDLILTFSLHFIKSCFKPAYQKVSDPEKIEKNIHSGMNLLNYGIIVAIVISLITCGFELYHYKNSEPEKRLLNLDYAILCYGMAAVWQALFQKYNVKNVLGYNYMRSAIIEMCSFLPKTLFVFVAAQLGLFEKWGILVFGLGQLIYAFLLFVISYWSSEGEYRNFRSVKIKDDQRPAQTYLVDKKTQESTREFLTLSVLKLGIQQFQKIALVTLDVSSFSSIYVLISNLGSIVVRYLFAPLQQVVYNYFTRGDQKQSVKTLILLVKSITLFSCLSLTFGYNFSEPFLGLLYGEKWVEADSVRALQIYTVLLSFLGINGIMEAFLFAKAGKEFKNYKYISIIPTAVYVVLSFFFIHYLNLGTGSFFLGNAVSMVIRIVISWNLEIKKHITLKNFILSIKPSNLFLLSLLATFLLGNPAVSYLGMSRFNSYLKDMLLGGILFGINGLVIVFENRFFFISKLRSLLKKQLKTQ